MTDEEWNEYEEKWNRKQQNVCIGFWVVVISLFVIFILVL